MIRPEKRLPDFSNLISVLEKKIPSRPTLFEFFLNEHLNEVLTGTPAKCEDIEFVVKAFDYAGYDYASIRPTRFEFIENRRNKKQTVSINDGACIVDRESFDAFEWKNPDDYSIEDYEKIVEYLPEKMKVIPWGPNGVLENVIALVGYENLCLMIYDDKQLVYDIFEKVGSTLLKYYKKAIEYDFVGAVMLNDDWGFNTQTMMSPDDMRRFVFPWHSQIAAMAHAAGKYAILHSCGRYDAIIDDVIDVIHFDARHSYEDNIVRVEDAYEQLKGRIAVLGGMDIDFMARRTPEEIYQRAKKMLERGMEGGGYALGTGNSVPEYIPDENYFAMVRAAYEEY